MLAGVPMCACLLHMALVNGLDLMGHPDAPVIATVGVMVLTTMGVL